jgi:hypothetical protein
MAHIYSLTIIALIIVGISTLSRALKQQQQ